ncbi:MAG TPA: hypothetical protein DDW52_04640 [Planctomycetaceae bacterium]|nr:hypothetical protein [Planctomycetaceae bacterium]
MIEKTQARLHAVYQAVAELILEGGTAAVTLSAVCRRAEISKGGLMHHFPSKESMVEQFVTHSGEACLREISVALEGIRPGGGQRTKAFIDEILIDPSMCHPENSRELAAVMIAMMQGSYIGDANQFYDKIYGELRGDGVSKAVIDLVVAAIDGLWLQSMVLAPEEVSNRAGRLRRQLRRMVSDDANS